MTDEQTTAAAEVEAESSSGGMNPTRIAAIIAGVLIGIIVVVIGIALLLAQGDVQQVAPIIQIIRDVFIIFLALQGVLIIIALTVLILQIARLVNLLQNEVKPILKNTEETVKTASGTVQFVSQNVTQPIVKVSGFLTGVSVLLAEVGGIRRAIRKADVAKDAAEQKDSEA